MNNQTKAFSEYYWIAASGAIERYCHEQGCFYIPAIFARLYFKDENIGFLLNSRFHFLRYIPKKEGEYDVETALLKFESKEDYEKVKNGFIGHMKLREIVNEDIKNDFPLGDFTIEVNKAIMIVEYIKEWHEERELNEMFEEIATEIDRCHKLLLGYPSKHPEIEYYIDVCEALKEEMPIIELRQPFDDLLLSEFCEIDNSKMIVDSFISFYEWGITALTEDLLSLFKHHIDNVKRLLNLNQLGLQSAPFYRQCIEDAREYLKRFQLLKYAEQQE